MGASVPAHVWPLLQPVLHSRPCDEEQQPIQWPLAGILVSRLLQTSILSFCEATTCTSPASSGLMVMALATGLLHILLLSKQGCRSQATSNCTDTPHVYAQVSAAPMAEDQQVRGAHFVRAPPSVPDGPGHMGLGQPVAVGL